MIILIAHAIIRHRLMDIRVKVRRGAVYLAAVLVAGLVLLCLLMASNAFFHDSNRAPVREILLALLVAVLFAPLKGQIQRAFDRYLVPRALRLSADDPGDESRAERHHRPTRAARPLRAHRRGHAQT